MRRQRLSPLFPYTTLFRSPVIGARVILTKGYTDEQLHAMTADTKRMALASEASSVKTPYFILGAVLFLIALAFAFTKLPAIQTTAGRDKSKSTLHAFKNTHLAWPRVPQF